MGTIAYVEICTCTLYPGAKPEKNFRGWVKMFWSLDQLFQARESNMFQMAYKYMYIVNNEFQDSRQEGGGCPGLGATN